MTERLQDRHADESPMPTPTSAPRSQEGSGPGSVARRLAGLALRGLLTLLLLLWLAWGLMALHYQSPLLGFWRWPASALWLALLLPSVAGIWWRRLPALLRLSALPASALMLGGWLSIAPRQDRDWADDVARQFTARISGSEVTLHDVRDFNWRSDTDYDIRWETRHYDLDQLTGADLVLSYWMGPAIAHTLVSFAFADGRHLVFSLEIRKQRGEEFSAIGGFFKSYEQVLIAADENDILRVRTNVRGEDDYLYHLNLSPALLRKMFVAYLGEAAKLRQHAAWYNTATSNCTTVVFHLARQVSPEHLPLDYRLLLSGYLAEYAYDEGALMPGYPFATLKALGRFTDRARATPADGDYSAAIRLGVPGEAGADPGRAASP